MHLCIVMKAGVYTFTWPSVFAGVQYVGVQVDVTSKTEGTSTGDQSGVPLLVKYDTRLKESNKHAVNEINATLEVKSARPLQLFGFKHLQVTLAMLLRSAVGEQLLRGLQCHRLYMAALDCMA